MRFEGSVYGRTPDSTSLYHHRPQTTISALRSKTWPQTVSLPGQDWYLVSSSPDMNASFVSVISEVSVQLLVRSYPEEEVIRDAVHSESEEGQRKGKETRFHSKVRQLNTADQRF